MVGRLAAFPERQPVLKRMAEAGERRGNLETSGEKGRKKQKGAQRHSNRGKQAAQRPACSISYYYFSLISKRSPTSHPK